MVSEHSTSKPSPSNLARALSSRSGRGGGGERPHDPGPRDRSAEPVPFIAGRLIRVEERGQYTVRLWRGDAGYHLISHLKPESAAFGMPAVAYRHRTFEAARAGFDILVACNELFWAMIRQRPFQPCLAEVVRLKRIAMETRARLDDSPGHAPPGLDERGASRSEKLPLGAPTPAPKPRRRPPRRAHPTTNGCAASAP